MKRLSRNGSSAAHDADEGSWSISYGDMVTLLLAFFILFFSIDPQKTKESSLAKSLLATLAPLTTKSDVGQPGPPSPEKMAAVRVDPEIARKLGATLTEIGQKIVVEFPDTSFFESGTTELSKAGARRLSDFAKLYIPFAGTHVLNIIGFTDERPLRSHKSGARDNLELSALRAVAAQRHLQHEGIPLDRMRLGGNGVARPAGAGADQAKPQATTLAIARRIVLVVEPEADK